MEGDSVMAWKMADLVRCKNCSEQYDPDDHSDPTWGAFVGPRYCGWCGAQEARIAAAAMGWD
jgi:hypothetical protein